MWWELKPVICIGIVVPHMYDWPARNSALVKMYINIIESGHALLLIIVEIN